MQRTLQILLASCWGVACVVANDSVSNNVPILRVTAPRLSEAARSKAAAITVISEDEISQSQAASVPELLMQKANLIFRSSTGNPSEGQPAMRGFGDNSGLRVLVEMDGHKVNRPDMGTVDWNQIPLADVAQIEILQGGQTVLYGNHALSGVIKITTKKGGPPGVNLRGVLGSNGFEQYTAHASTCCGLWYADGGVDYLRNEGFRDNALSWSKTMNACTGRFVGDNANLTVKATIGENYTQLPGPLTEEQMKEDPTQSRNFGNQEIWSTNGLFTLRWESEHDWGETELGAGYTFRDSTWSLDGIYAHNSQQGVSLTPRVQLGLKETHLILGWDFFYDQLQHDNYENETYDDPTASAELSRITTGPYIFAQKELSDTLILNGGIRYETASTDNHYVAYDYINPTDPFIDNPILGQIPNPDYDPNLSEQVVNSTNSYEGMITKSGWAAEASVIWNPLDQLSLWLGYDRSYRYPVLDETASYQGYPLSDPLNENLEPETGNSFETGIKYANNHVSCSMTGYYMLLDGEIAYYEKGDTKLNINLGSTERMGTEMEAAISYDTAGASVRWEFVEARFTDGPYKGKTIPLVPSSHGTVSVWVKPTDRLRLSGSLSYISDPYQGSDFENQKSKIDSYSLTSTRIDFTLTDSALLFFKVSNLFDKTYATSAYSGNFYPGAGRSFQIGLSWKM